MARNWTDEQKTAIGTTDKTVLLSAAAGSGKTATLTERLIRMVTRKENPLDVSRMLVATFTRDAAEELRVRIAEALDRELASDPENAHLLRASLLLPSAKIRTIDSFCNDLVKGHTETLGIKPHYRIPDAAEANLLIAELFDELIFDAYNGTYAPKGLDIATLAECTVGARNDKDLCTLLSDLYEKLGGYPDGLGIIKKNAEEMEAGKSLPFFETRLGEVIKNAALEMLTDHESGLSRALSEVKLEGDGLFLSALGTLSEELLIFLGEAKRAAETSYTALRTVLTSLPKPKKDPPAGDGKLTESGFLAKHYRKRILSDIEDFFETYLVWEEKDIPVAFEKNAALGKSVYLLLLEFERRFTEEKRSRGLCTYNDLERYAYTLLIDKDGSRTPLAHELAASFDAVCIDEYQDVNDIQHLIFEAISTPKNRFMVGDIKQSIYYFRGARPDIFARLRRSFPSLDKDEDKAVLYLTKNFRSLPHLARFNNGIFDFLFGKLGDSIGYVRADRLDAARSEPDTPQPLPEIFYLHKPNLSLYGEWDMLALKIKDLLQNGKRADGSPILPSDIAVLYRQSKAKRFEIASALTQYGIPVSTEDTQNFFSFPEILLALCLLNAVNNPRRDVYLTGLLRSPLYGFSMDELLRIKRGAGKECTSLYDALCAFVGEHPDFKKGALALSDLKEFRSAAKNMPSDKLCDILFRKTSLYALADEAGRERLNVLYDHARTFESNRFHGLYPFVEHLSELIEAGYSLGGERLFGDTNGVKIGTMHSSKGLEYPVTFIVNALPRGSNQDIPLRFHSDFGVAFKVRDSSGLGIMENPVRRAVIHAATKDEGDEEIRVLYVALTRACEQLYVTAASNSKPETVETAAAIARAFPSATLLKNAPPLTAILAAVGADRTLCRYSVLYQSDIEGKEEPPAGDTEGTAAPEEKKAPESDAEATFRERFSFRYPYPERALPGKVSVSRLYPALLDEAENPLVTTPNALPTASDAEKKKEKTVPFFLSGVEGDLAAKAGTATHLFLQFCRFEALLPSGGETAHALVEKELSRLVGEGFIHKSDAERVRKDELTRFAESPLLSRILSAKRVFRELRFNTMLPAPLFSKENPKKYEGHLVFTQGVIDLVLENADGTLTLCDYKTDRLRSEALKDGEKAKAFLCERHGTQLYYYAEALERIFGKRPEHIEIFSLHAGKSFEITPNL